MYVVYTRSISFGFAVPCAFCGGGLPLSFQVFWGSRNIARTDERSNYLGCLAFYALQTCRRRGALTFPLAQYFNTQLFQECRWFVATDQRKDEIARHGGRFGLRFRVH